ncbi:hypothetical protein F5I97DRAFT_1926861 [Phlebopus sp. FC_14]|nr:hypothetical protein F5I97DRAFT_1926861 [Phlebopus sp. FC_14]
MRAPGHRSPTMPISIMTSSSSNSPTDDTRPTGGTARRSGSRTPRRVQWATSDDVRVSVDSAPSSPRSSMHALDEAGLDPNAFETLKDALERHKSLRGSENDLGRPREGEANSSAPPSGIPIPLRIPPSAPRASASVPDAQQNPFATPSLPTWNFPPGYANTNNPYARMTPPAMALTDSTYPPQTTIDSSPSTDTGTPFSSSPLLAQRTHDVPGEVWIDPLEREGLPVESRIPDFDNTGEGGSRLNARRNSRRGSRDTGAGERHVERLAAHQAAGVVRAHTRRGWGWLHRKARGKKSQGPDKENEDHDEKTGKGKHTTHRHRRHHHHATSDTDNDDTDFTDIEIDGARVRQHGARKGVPASWFIPMVRQSHLLHHADHDPERHAHGTPSGPRLGTGVLSTLLALYGHDHYHEEDGSISGASTPGRRSHASSDGESEHERGLEEPVRPWMRGKDDEGRKQTTSEGQKAKVPQETGTVGRSSKSGSASASSLLGNLKSSSRPATPSTAALITGAGTLGGAAVPQQTALAPNLKRPGYGLVRYSMENVPTTTTTGQEQGQPTTSKPALHTPRRTRSTDFDFTRAVGGRVSEEGEHTDVESPGTLAAHTPPSSPMSGHTDRPLLRTGRDEVATPESGPATPAGGRKRWSGVLKDLPLPISLSASHFKGFSLSLPGTPWERTSSASVTPKTVSVGGTPIDEFGEKKDYFDMKLAEKENERIKERERRERKERKEREREREKEKRRKRKKAEVYITRHVAAILQRQEFIMKLARAMMMFGGPSHRLAAQIQSTGRVLDLELSCMYLPDVMLISFEDSATGTSNVKFIRQGSALDLEKLGEAHSLYWKVIHDAMSVSVASASLDVLMRKKPLYNFTQLIFVGGMCSASICSVSFAGSFIDSLASAPLGALLVAIQLLSVRNELYGNVFEITIATLLSFASAALASTKHFCYSAVASSSVVLILPGFIVLCGSLELSSRSLVAGAVRLCFALMYSLFLGFGLAIGAELYQKLAGEPVFGATDYTCVDSHDPMGPWWQQTPSLWWAFLTVPMYSLFLSMRLMAPWRKKELILLIAISCIGWVTNHFVSTKFPNQSDISAAVGAFAVGFVSNMYGRFFNGNAFVVMITGILFQVPSGLGNGGLLNFVSDQTSGSSSSYLSGFQTALQLISVAIGLTVGLGISLVVVHPIQSRRRAGGLFSL